MTAGSGDLVFDLIRRHGINGDALQSGIIQPSHSDAALTKANNRLPQWSALQRPVDLLDASGIKALTGVAGWRGACRPGNRCLTGAATCSPCALMCKTD